MTITNPSSSLIKTGSLTSLPSDILGSIGGYLDNKDQRVLAAVCKIFKATYNSSLFDRIIPGDPEKGEPLTISRLIPAHRALASAMCAMGTKNAARFQQPICTKTLKIPYRGFPHVLSSDGQTIIAGIEEPIPDTKKQNYIIKIYDTETGTCKGTLSGHTEEVTALALRPDGKVLISGSINGALKIWDVETGTCTRSQETAPPKEKKHSSEYLHFRIKSIMITPDKMSFISKSRGGLIQIWDIETGTCKETLVPQKHCHRHERSENILITPDKKKFISLDKSENVFVIWNIETGKKEQTLQNTLEMVERIDITPNGRYFISQASTAVDSEYQRGSLVIYDLENSTIKKILKGLKITPFFTLTPDGEKVIAAFRDGTIKIYDIETTECKSILVGQGLQALAVTADGASLIAHFGCRGTRIYDIESLACLHTMASNRRHSQITLASDGRTFLLGGGCSIEIWKLHPLLLEDVMTSANTSLENITRYALLDTSQYLKMIAERKDRPSSNLCSSAVQFAINRIWSLPPEIQQELYREYRTPTLTEGPIASFLQRINELPEEMQELFSAKLEEAASQEPRTPLSLPPELAQGRSIYSIKWLYLKKPATVQSRYILNHLLSSTYKYSPQIYQ